MARHSGEANGPPAVCCSKGENNEYNEFIKCSSWSSGTGPDLGIMAIGVYITFRILDFADLTVDGSLCTGGAVCIMKMLNGQNVWVAMFAALLAGWWQAASPDFYILLWVSRLSFPVFLHS